MTKCNPVTNTYCEDFCACAHSEEDFGLNIKKKQQPAETYWYLITFTLKPEAIKKAKKAQNWIADKFRSIKSMKNCRYFIWSHELTKLKVSHWHAAVNLPNKLNQSDFSNYKATYGNVDIKPSWTMDYVNTIAYVLKHCAPPYVPVIEKDVLNLTRLSDTILKLREKDLLQE